LIVATLRLPGRTVAAPLKDTASVPRVLLSQRAYVVSWPDAGGVAHALLDAVQLEGPTGLLIPVVERRPEPEIPPVGTKFGATE
jgi:hypothetical protein